MVLVIAGLCLAGLTASAQEPAFATPDEARDAITTAQTDLDAALAQTASDCSAACVALASMQRAAERLCELEPGPRCDTARKRVDAARRRVAERCPTCEALRTSGGAKVPAHDPGPEPPPGGEGGFDRVDDAARAEKTEGGDPQAQQDEAKDVVLTGAPANAPPSEESTAGCAACRLGGADDPRGLWALVLAALALGLRRR